LVAANVPPVLFVRGRKVVRVTIDRAAGPMVEEVDRYSMNARLIRSADFCAEEWQLGVPVRKPANPPMSMVHDILALGEWPFPALDGIIECPTLRPDGTVLDQPGYDPATRLILAPSPDLNMAAIPSEPTPDDRAKALDLLWEALADFPFDSGASRANALAALMTTVIRPCIDGPIPLGLITAPQKGTGKTFLAEVFATVATGRSPGLLVAARDGDEWRKRITSTVLSGAPIVVIDNVSEELAAPELSMLLTARMWQDRKLGASENVVVPARAVWFATGNNIQVGGDLPRRCYLIRLDAKSARPWERADWKHPDLLRWVRQNRGDLIRSVLILARAWFAAGKPKGEAPRLNSFAAWVDTAGGILALAGVLGFLANQVGMEQTANPEEQEWETFFLALYHHVGSTPLKAKGLWELITQNGELRDVVPTEIKEKTEGLSVNESKGATTLGRALRQRVDRRYGQSGVRVEAAGQDGSAKVALWRIVTGGPGTPGGQNPPLEIQTPLAIS